MARKLLLQFLLLALPFVTYFLYVKLANRGGAGGTSWRKAPWYWLLTTGLVLSIVGTVALIVLGGGEPYSEYVPAAVQDGTMVPGHFK